jgi:transposase
MSKKRRKFGIEFKTKVVLEILKERESLEILSKKYELAPSQLSQWKQEALSNFSKVFLKDKSEGTAKEKEQELKQLYQVIGQQKIEIEYLKKNL